MTDTFFHLISRKKSPDQVTNAPFLPSYFAITFKIDTTMVLTLKNAYFASINYFLTVKCRNEILILVFGIEIEIDLKSSEELRS
jgi:hypothetical protein